MEFCPDCEKRMIPLKKKKAKTVTLILACPKCGNEKKYTRPDSPAITDENHFLEKLITVGKKEQRLRTAPKFDVVCPKCSNKKAYGWTVHLGTLEQSSTQFYRCTNCNYTFRDTS